MTIGTNAGMVIFQEEFYSGFMDSVVDKIDVFNQATLNTLTFSTMYHQGYQVEEAFWTDTISLQHRDVTSTSELTPDSFAQDSLVVPKAYKAVLAEQSLQSFRTIQADPSLLSFMVGQKFGEVIMRGWRDSAMSALSGAFDVAGLQSGADQLVHDISQVTSGGVFDMTTLTDALALYGDQTDRLKLIIMHPQVYWRLVKEAVTSVTTPATADFAVQNALPQTYGIPIYVINHSSLVDAAGGADGQDAYKTFVLTDNAISIHEAEPAYADMDKNIKRANSTAIFKAELAYDVKVKGMSYGGSNNPNDTTLATAASWTKAYSSKLNLPGIMIKSVVVANDATA